MTAHIRVRVVTALAAIGAFAIAFAYPAAAGAASASVVAGTVVYLADPGEANAVTVEGDPFGIVIEDSGATIVAGPGCVAATLSRVLCMVPVDGLVSVDLGDLDDTFGLCPSGACPPPSNSFAVDAGAGNDVVNLGAISRPSTLLGGPGDDVLTGGEGGDVVDGGAGDDVVDSGGGAPVFPVDSVRGGPGNDVLRLRTRNATALGGDGVDLVDYSFTTVPFTIRLGGFSGQTGFEFQFISDDVENARAGAGNDTLIGSEIDNVLEGGDGEDVIDARGGDDTVLSRDGFVDAVACGEGDDAVVADPIDDIASDCEMIDTGADTTPPTIICSATPGELWPPNHALRPVAVEVVAEDESGSVNVVLLAATSSQPDSGLDPEDVPNDLQDWSIGTDDRAGLLRAERFREARLYRFIYQAADAAGNTATCEPTVVVPKSQRR